MTSFKKKSDGQMVALYGEVIGELHRRGIVRSGNNPIADLAETVVADYFGVEPEPPNQKSYDVKTKDGKRIQVKALRRTKSTRRGLSAIRTLGFDYVAMVIFELDMELVEVVLIPLAAVKAHMGWSKTWKSHRLSVTKKLLDDRRVRRIPVSELNRYVNAY
jgi:hypothetical protein